MELVFRITLFVAGIINLLPSILAFLPDKISESYGISIPDANYELLLRHRAILFGIIGGLMIFSAVMKKHYIISSTAGLISMMTFILLYFVIGEGVNAELKKVMLIDAVATIVLFASVILFVVTSRNSQQ